MREQDDLNGCRGMIFSAVIIINAIIVLFAIIKALQ